MTAKEIRALNGGDPYKCWHDGSERTQVLIEIAAQLAELNETLYNFANPGLYPNFKVQVEPGQYPIVTTDTA